MNSLILTFIGCSLLIIASQIQEKDKGKKNSIKNLQIILFLIGLVIAIIAFIVPLLKNGTVLNSSIKEVEFEVIKIDLFESRVEYINEDGKVRTKNIQDITEYKFNNMRKTSLKKIEYVKRNQFLGLYFDFNTREYILEIPENIKKDDLLVLINNKNERK